MLFDKICRKNAITHRLTEPASPNQNGKVERFHGTFRSDFLDVAEPFTSFEQAQVAVDAWVGDYNTDRPHQALDDQVPVTPADRLAPVSDEQRELIELWLPPTLSSVEPSTDDGASSAASAESAALVRAAEPMSSGGAVAFDRVVPASGNMSLSGRQCRLGPHRAGAVVRFWADTEVIYLLIAGARIKSVRSHLSVTDLARLTAEGTVPAGPPPLPTPESGDAIEVDRVVSRAGTVSLGQHLVLAAKILGGPQVGVRVEPESLMFFDLTSRELLRTRANPLTPAETARIGVLVRPGRRRARRPSRSGYSAAPRTPA